MKLRQSILALGFLVGIIAAAPSALACGDYCGLFGTTGYGGYSLGSTMYDISSYTTTSTTTYVDYGYTGGCGSFMSTCGSSGPSVCGGGCGSGGGQDPYDFNYTSPYSTPFSDPSSSNPYSNPYTNPFSPGNPMVNPYMDPFMNPMMGMSTVPNPFMMPPGMNPIFSMMGPQTFPPFTYPGLVTTPYPGYNPTIPTVSFLPSSMSPYYPNTTNPYYPGTPTTTTYNPTGTTYGPIMPGTNNPVVNPITPIVSAPPTNPLPWGGCDNVVVMCPTGTVTRPPTVTTTPIIPLSPPITASPQYQTTPMDPNRQQIPRGIVTTHGGVR